MSQPVTVDAASAAPWTCTRDPSHGWRPCPLSSTVTCPHPFTATIIIILWRLSVCVVNLSDCAIVPVRLVWPSQPVRCFVLADMWEHVTCVMGASGNSDDITISSWTSSRYRDPKKYTIWALKVFLCLSYFYVKFHVTISMSEEHDTVMVTGNFTCEKKISEHLPFSN